MLSVGRFYFIVKQVIKL